MGSAQSYPGLTQDVLEDYASLTYLTKGEIMYLMKKFYSIDPEKIKNNYHHRFSREHIVNKFCVLKNNPFQDRIFSVFSSKDDDCFSFEDLVDLCSAMSAGCPAEVKAAWAFRIFDLDEDGQITEKDISKIVDRLTWSVIDDRITDNHIDRDSKLKIAKVYLHDSEPLPQALEFFFGFFKINVKIEKTADEKFQLWGTDFRIIHDSSTEFMVYYYQNIRIQILDEINLDKSGGIGLNEFKLIMARLPEFPTSFYFRL